MILVRYCSFFCYSIIKYRRSKNNFIGKKLALFSLIIFSLSAIADHSNTPVADWRLDEGAWRNLNIDVLDDVLDYSGNDFHGDAVNGAQTSDAAPVLAGNPGTCGYGQFDGADDYLSINYRSAFNPVNFTVSFWARPDGGSGYRSPVTSRNDAGGITKGYLAYLNPSNHWEFWVGTGSGAWAPIDAGPAVMNQWTHIAATFNATSSGGGVHNGVLSVYINGVLAGQQLTNYMPNDGRRLTIGAGADGAQFFFNGDVDEVRVFDVALDAADIVEEFARRHNCTANASIVDQAVLNGLFLPTDVEFAPDGRVFVAEKFGSIKAFDSIDDPSPTTVINLSVQGNGDQGLLGLAIDSQFPTRPYIYVSYALPNPTSPAGRVSRITINPATNQAIGGEQVLLTNWCHGGADTHAIDDVDFGPDGALYVSAGEWGAPSNIFASGSCGGDPGGQTGSFRSQDRQSSGDPQGLNGTIIRLHPDTGAPMPGNPFITSADPALRYVIADGLRNPFRISFRNNTSELWITDVGQNGFEEVNRISSTIDGNVRNFGWPCYEGNQLYAPGQSANPGICAAVATEHQPPAINYPHLQPIFPEDQCTPGLYGSALSGVAFYEGGDFPIEFENAGFLADFSRNCIHRFSVDSGGNVIPGSFENFVPSARSPVDIEIGPNGDVYYASIFDGTIRRVSYAEEIIEGDNLSVNTTGTQSSTNSIYGPELATDDNTDGVLSNNSVSMTNVEQNPWWEIDLGAVYDITNILIHPRTDCCINDLANFHVFISQAAFNSSDLSETQNQPGVIDFLVVGGTDQAENISINAKGRFVRVQLNDINALSLAEVQVFGDAESAIFASPPTVSILQPSSLSTWSTGDTLSFSGSAIDEFGAPIDSGNFNWTVLLHHCIGTIDNCHQHPEHVEAGVSNGIVTGPDHGYPSFLEYQLSVLDPNTGLTGFQSVETQPNTVPLTFNSNPTGAAIEVGDLGSVSTPFTGTFVTGSGTTITASESQTISGTNYLFTDWQDGSPRVRTIINPPFPTSFTANYEEVDLSFFSIAEWNMEEEWSGQVNEVINSADVINHGQAIGGANTTEINAAIPGDPGTCSYGQFNGFNQRVMVPYDATLNPNGDFTISLWARVDGNQGQFRSPITTRSEVGGVLRGYMLYASFDNKWAVQIGSSSEWSYIDGGNVVVGDWTHIAATFDSTSVNGGVHNGTLSLYIDGVQVNQAAVRYVPNPIQPLFIGSGGDFGTQFYFNGGIDSVNIFSEAFTAAEVTTLASATQNCGTGVPIVTAPADMVVEATAIETPVNIGTATANDSVDGVIVATPSTSGPFALGGTTVTWSATDSDGNTGVADQVITVIDTTAPNITAPLDVTTSSMSETSVAIGNATASDIFAVTVSNDAPALFPIGTTVVTWTAVDASGNISSDTQSVTVDLIPDTAAPVVTAPANITAEATGNLTIVNIGTATAVDAVDANPTITPNNSGPFGLGAHTIIWSATDAAGNTGTANQTVTIVDTTAPVLTIPSDVTLQSPVATAVNIGQATATDAFSLNITNDAPAIFQVGTTIVTWTATDINGNSSSGQQLVNVTQFTPIAEWNMEEQWTGQANEVVNNAGVIHNGQAIGGANTTDINSAIPGDPGTCSYGQFNGFNQQVTVPYNETLNLNGDFTISLWARVDGNQGQFRSPLTTRSEAGGVRRGYMLYATFNNKWAVQLGSGSIWGYIDGGNVVVGDWTHIAATYDSISVSGGVHTGTLSLYIDGIQVNQTAAQYVPNITQPLFIGAGGNFGNEFYFNGGIDSVNIFSEAFSVAEITTLASDTQNCGTGVPIVTAPADMVVEATAIETPVNIGTATANDSVDGVIVATPSTSGPFALGNTTVTWSATDSDGNTGVADQVITVIDTTAPNITAPLDVTTSSMSETSVAIGNATASDIFAVTVSNDAPALFPIGTTVVTWTAVDISGNISSDTQSVTVDLIPDTVAPVVTVPANITAEATGNLTIVNIGTATAVDAVDANPTITPSNSGPFGLGAHTIIWSATDAAGNTGTANQTVTVVDTTAPVLTIPSDVTLQSPVATAVNIGQATATDAFSLNITNDAPAIFQVGTTIVTWTATDINGNSSSGQQMVNITLFAPIAEWNMGEEWSGQANEVINSADVINHGQAIGGANTTDIDSVISGAEGTCSYGEFNGSNQRVMVPYNPALNPNGDFTISLWARVDGSQGQFRSPLTTRSGSGGVRRGYMLYATFTNKWAVQLGSGSTWGYIDGGNVIVGNWTHVAATYDSISVSGGVHTGTLSLYVNGELINQTQSQYIPNNSQGLSIGAGGDFGTQFYFNGGIDSVNIFNETFTPAEISLLIDSTQNCDGEE